MEKLNLGMKMRIYIGQLFCIFANLTKKNTCFQTSLKLAMLIDEAEFPLQTALSQNYNVANFAE